MPILSREPTSLHQSLVSATGWRAGWRGLRLRPGRSTGRVPRDLWVNLATLVLIVVCLAALMGGLSSGQRANPALRMAITPAAAEPPRPFDPGATIALPPGRALVSNASVPPEQAVAHARPYANPMLVGNALDRAVDCLAAAVWYEAGDHVAAQRAVAQIVLNRARHPSFPHSICGVVFENAASSQCQFPATCAAIINGALPGPAEWARARAVARAAIGGAVEPAVGLATHYHRASLVPVWRDAMVKLGGEDGLLFYRWPGYWGSTAAYGDNLLSANEPRIAAMVRLSAAHAPTGPAPVAEPGETPGHLTERRDEALRLLSPGHSDIRHSANDAVTRIELLRDTSAEPANDLRRALALCHGRNRCLVYARPGTASRPALGFLYMTDHRHGPATGWWNCAATPAADRKHCLPSRSGSRIAKP